MRPWEEVRTARKAGRPEEALRLAESRLLEEPNDFQTRSQAEWACFDLIKEVVVRIQGAIDSNPRPQRKDLDRLLELLRIFTRLDPHVPDMALSNILGQLTRIGRHFDRFLPFVKWAGVGGLRPEDFQANHFQEKVYPSLAVKLAREIAAWVKARPDTPVEQIEFAVDLARAVLRDANDSDKTWLEWSLAILLRQAGDRRGAAELIVRVLKRKRAEFWAWAEAARIHRDEQPELAISCYCQALRLGAEPKFLGKVHRELAELLADVGDAAQATSETLIAVKTYDQEGWRHPPELEALLQSDWYDPSMPAIESRTFYLQHADDALTLCFDQVSEAAATYLGMTEGRDRKKPRPRFAFRYGDGAVTILGRRNARALKSLEPGKPVRLLVGIDGDRRDVLEVLPRNDGMDWDCTDGRVGVISRVSAGGDGLSVYCDRNCEMRLPISAWGGTTSPNAGMGVVVRGATNPLNGNFEAGRLEPTPLVENGDIGIFKGRLNRNAKGFGFIHDVFVPAQLIEANSRDTDEFMAVAIMAFDKSKQRHSWRAIALGPCR